MTINELLKELTENLTTEQKAMNATFADTDGTHYVIDALYVVTKSANTGMPEGQVVLAAFGTDAVGTE